MITYRGFSTLVSPKKFSLNDFALAKQDLVNYFSIRKGEKLMQPNFGTVIWSLLFEPLTETIQQEIQEDVSRIVSYDPRLAVGQIMVKQQTNGFLVQITLSYVNTNQAETLSLNFNKNSQTLTAN